MSDLENVATRVVEDVAQGAVDRVSARVGVTEAEAAVMLLDVMAQRLGEMSPQGLAAYFRARAAVLTLTWDWQIADADRRAIEAMGRISGDVAAALAERGAGQ